MPILWAIHTYTIHSTCSVVYKVAIIKLQKGTLTMTQSLHCSNCGCGIHAHEDAIRVQGFYFCSQECIAEFEQDNLGHAVKMSLQPIEEEADVPV